MTQAVIITRVWDETPEIRCFELAPIDGTITSFEPGAHIDIHLPNGLIRQYSLWNGPEKRTAYLIGVKRERKGRGGSEAMHSLEVGTALQIGPPKNHFPLTMGKGPIVFMAGGIGITPILAMAQHCHALGVPFRFHVFARDEAHTPFRDLLAALPGVELHLGINPDQIGSTLATIFASQERGADVYLCGPSPFMEAIESQAARAGWSQAQIHLERFTVEAEAVDLVGDEFKIVLAQSGAELKVGANQTIVEAMTLAGIIPLTSCELGVCGTCQTTVLEGVPDHRDYYLSDNEKAAGNTIMICVSRCKGQQLVLDL